MRTGLKPGANERVFACAVAGLAQPSQVRSPKFFARAQFFWQTEQGVGCELGAREDTSPTSVFELAGVRCRTAHLLALEKDDAVYR
jgi:hypothetical protein